MFVSAARKKLNAAIQAATDPAEIALLTASMSCLIDAEGRARGKRPSQPERADALQNRAFDSSPFTVLLPLRYCKPRFPGPTGNTCPRWRLFIQVKCVIVSERIGD
jgi:hypothetical protein